MHHLPVDDETCLVRVRQRNEKRPAGLFSGLGSDALVMEVGSLAESDHFILLTMPFDSSAAFLSIFMIIIWALLTRWRAASNLNDV